MYDTLANYSLAGCTPCSNPKGMGNPYGLGACGGERAERERRSTYKNSLQNSILPSLKKQVDEYKTGKQQKAFTQLEEEITQLRIKIEAQKVEKSKVEKIRDTWRETPDIAAADPSMGLGSLLSRMFSCSHYENDIKNLNYEIIPLEKKKSEYEKELKGLEAKMSPEKQQDLSRTKQFLTSQLNQINNEINSLKSEIKTYKEARATRLETEKLAAQKAAMEAERERYRTEAEAKAKAAREVADAKINEAKAQADNLRLQLDAKNQQPEKKDNTMTYVMIGGAALAVMFLLRGGGNKTIIKGRV